MRFTEATGAVARHERAPRSWTRRTHRHAQAYLIALSPLRRVQRTTSRLRQDAVSPRRGGHGMDRVIHTAQDIPGRCWGSKSSFALLPD